MKNKLIGKFKSNNIVDLGKIYCIDEAIISIVKPTEVYYSLDNVRYFKTNVSIKDNNFRFNNLIARYIKFDYECEIEVYEGEGYIGEYNEEWTNVFVQDQYWVGGDGLFSFNLTGKDNYDSNIDDKTICVFGDTFACTLGKDESRLDPLAMPNNSYCLLNSIDPKKTDAKFFINEDEKGHCMAYLSPTNDLAYIGTMATNLVDYNPENKGNYLSGRNPKNKIEITFDLKGKHYVEFIDVYNYFMNVEVDLDYANRGIRELEIYLDDRFFSKVIIDRAEFKLKGKNYTRIYIDKEFRFMKFVIDNTVGKGNYGGANHNESFFGLNKVYIYENKDRYYESIEVDCNSEFLRKEKHSWFWLQDGVLLNNKFYSLPYVVSSDDTQPEGFKFKIEGINLIECDVKENDIDFVNNKQMLTNLYKKYPHITWNFGCGFLNNEDVDGYIYIYGYTSEFLDLEHGNRLRVARVKKESFLDLNEWRFFNGVEFVKEMEKAAPMLDHVSCELSVHKDKDKYIAVYTYDVQSRYIAYALSDTPYGPFDEPRIAYVCKENLCEHMYLYNAKAHPHLSKEGDILVSYNINTSNFDENIKYGRTYGPRFINLKKIGGSNNEN